MRGGVYSDRQKRGAKAMYSDGLRLTGASSESQLVRLLR
jgi:hypothetical protein